LPEGGEEEAGGGAEKVVETEVIPTFLREATVGIIILQPQTTQIFQKNDISLSGVLK
jgi:hypothetical protein